MQNLDWPVRPKYKKLKTPGLGGEEWKKYCWLVEVATLGTVFTVDFVGIACWHGL